MKCAPMAIIAVLVLSPTGAAQAAGVNPAGIGTTGIDVEIVLAADVSRSIDDGEFELQRRGYAAALTDPRVLKAIHRTKDGAIGVCFIEWSGENEQRVVLGWTEIRDAEDGGDAAAVIRKAPRSFTGRTSISAAIDFARAYFGKAKWGSTLHRIIDVSGDGNSNAGRPLAEARDDAVATGITINGLAIINEQASFAYSAHTHPPGGLPNYYRQNVIGGPNAFLLVVKDFNSFADAMANKLAKEIDIANAAGGTAVAALR